MGIKNHASAERSLQEGRPPQVHLLSRVRSYPAALDEKTFVDSGADDDLLEDETGRFDEDFLIPSDSKPRPTELTTDRDVETLAREIDLAPGVVVGSPQHDDL